MKMKTPPVLPTTFEVITNRQNVRETLYETVSQVSSEKKKQYTTLATAGRQIIVYLQRKRLDVAIVEHAIERSVVDHRGRSCCC